MPELPEVETTKRGITPYMHGQRFVSVDLQRPDIRFPIPPNLPDLCRDQIVTDITRRAKYILIHMNNDYVMLLHLGMSGRIKIVPQGTERALHDHVVFTMENGSHQLIFHDPRRFGILDITKASLLHQHKLLGHLGVEPLSGDFNTTYLAQAFNRKTAPLKNALLDQSIVVGLGNIYVCEALFKTGLHPEMRACDVPIERLPVLIHHCQDVLKQAIAAGGSTLKDYRQVSGELGYFHSQFNVYGRTGEACYTCGTPIERIRQAGRSTFFCPSCQPYK